MAEAVRRLPEQRQMACGDRKADRQQAAFWDEAWGADWGEKGLV